MARIRTISLESGAQAPLESHDELESTNDTVRDHVLAGARPAPYSTISTTSQTGGHGRHGRVWVAPPGRTVAISTYFELDAPVTRAAIGWIPLAAGLALRDAILDQAPGLAGRVGIKWPNDVQVDGRKIAGILGELLGPVDAGARFAGVVGTGVNLTLTAEELPTATSTSLALVGVTVDRDALIDAVVRGLARRVDALVSAGGDADSSGLREEFRAHCTTLGTRVRVLLPTSGTDGRPAELRGTAVDAGPGGDLLVRVADGEIVAVNAGDVEHLRPDDQAGAVPGRQS